MSAAIWVFLCSLGALALPPALSASEPPAGIDPALWAKMLEIDARAGKISTLVADFEQKKQTTLLKKPLVSSGTIRVRGTTMRWDTRQPTQSVLLINDREVKIFYPNPAPGVLEIYPIDQRMGELAASPLPRLAVLRSKFSFRQIAVKELDETADAEKHLAFSLKPIDAALREHVEEVRVLLDVSAAYIVKAEMIDADGDRTTLRFTNVKVNVEPGETDFKVPAGARITRPLDGLNKGR